MSFMMANHSKLRSFQILLLHNTIVANKKIKQYKIKQHDRCTFCDLEQENTFHLFYQCSYVQQFYIQVQNYINTLLPFIHLDDLMSARKIFFNKIIDNPSSVVNLPYLVAKYHVHRKRCAGLLPNIKAYQQEVILMRNIEKYNAKKSQKLDKHILKWYNVKLSPDDIM